MPTRFSSDEQQEMQQIIGAMPSRIWHRGILLVLVIFISLMVIAYFVRYPDVIEMPVYINDAQPAIEVKTSVGEELELLLVDNEQMVEKGQSVAIFKSGASFEHMQKLEQHLKQLATSDFFTEADELLSKNWNLGTMQGDWGRLQMLLKKMKDQQQFNHGFQRAQTLKEEQRLVEELNNSLERQIDKLDQEVQLAESNYKDFQKLHKDGAASKIEMESAKTIWLSRQRQLESNKAAIIQNNLIIKEKDGLILQLLQSEEEDQAENYRNIRSAISNLESLLDQWKTAYVVQAPVAGKVNFSQVINAGQFMEAGSTLFSISSGNSSGQLSAIGKLAGPGAGKVKTSLPVFIRLTGFPYKEFGEVEGKVEQIGLVPASENGVAYYQVDISLTDGLETNFGQKIKFRHELPGVARVITADKSLIQRFFEIFYF